MSTVTPTKEFVDVRPEVQSSRVVSPPQLTQFEIKSMEEQQRKLKYFTDATNEELQQGQEREVITNLSLSTIWSRFASTIIAIINELLTIQKDTPFSDVVYIFIKEDRLIYLGLLLITISVAIYLIDVTS